MRIPVVVVVLGMLGTVIADREVRPGQLQEPTQHEATHLLDKDEENQHEHHHKKPKQKQEMTWIFLHQKLPLVRPNPKLVVPSETFPNKFETEDDDDNFNHHHKHHSIERDPVPKPHLVEEDSDDDHEDRNEVEHHHKGEHHQVKHHHSGHHEKPEHIEEHVIAPEAHTTTRYIPDLPEEPTETTDKPEIYLEEAAIREPFVLSVTEGKTEGKQDYSGLPSILQPIIPGGGGSRFEDVERERLEEAKMSQVKEKLDDSDATSMGAESLSSGSLSIILSSSLLLQATLILQFPVFRIVP
ncbi:unnamed protein product [Meganyctiphanes norvegica]|uniref:Uncharacterized protein n=1 Tax=Meganyctiphanes norvegica TaxID=48144 RepID=A0AAV2R5Y9_MEGNR